MQQITNVSIDVLKVHPRNQEFYDDIEGEQYEKFKKSIQEDGILTPLIVSPDMTIVSGHQRYKGAYDLGYKLLPVIIREDLDNEDEKLKKLLATNFGRLKNNPVKQGKVYAEYEKLCGVQHGGARPKNSVLHITQQEIAKQLGVSVDTIQNLKKLQTLSPELQQLIEDGSVKYTTALNVFSKLPNDEQEKLINEIGQDRIKEMTSKQIQQYILEKQQLEETNKALEQSFNELSKKYNQAINKQPEIIKVDNTDYSVIEKLKKELEDKTKLYNIAKEKEEIYKNQLDLYEKDSQKYKDLTRQIELLTKEKDDIGRAIKSATELSGYIYEIETFLKTKLAPLNYSRSLIDCQNNPVVTQNITDIVECVEKWCMEIRKYLPKQQQNIINVEEI